MALAVKSKFNTRWVFFGATKESAPALQIMNELIVSSLAFEDNQEAVKVFEHLLNQAQEAANAEG